MDPFQLGVEHSQTGKTSLVKKTTKGYRFIRSPGIKLDEEEAQEFAQEYLEGYSSHSGEMSA